MPTQHLCFDVTQYKITLTSPYMRFASAIEIFKFDSDAIKMIILNQTSQIFSNILKKANLASIVLSFNLTQVQIMMSSDRIIS